MPVLEMLPLIEDIRLSRVQGQTIFEMAQKTPFRDQKAHLHLVCQHFLNIADQLLTEPEGVIPRELADNTLFSLLSEFYFQNQSNPQGSDKVGATPNFVVF